MSHQKDCLAFREKLEVEETGSISALSQAFGKTIYFFLSQFSFNGMRVMLFLGAAITRVL